MKKSFVRALNIVLVLVMALSLGALPLPVPERPSSDKIIVKYTDGSTAVVGVPLGMSARALQSRYLSRGDVSWTEADQTATMTSVTPDDTYYKLLQVKTFDNMSITDAWDITGGSSNIVVAVLDSGVDAGHPDLKGKVLSKGYNFIDNNTDASDSNGHGTMCAGIIAGCVNNASGIAGATLNCSILPVKVLDEKGNGSISNIAAGIRYAVDNGADVINLSLGCPNYSQTLQDAVNYAWDKGVIVIAASGNTGGAVQYPAACSNAVAVGAVTASNEVAAYSNRGSSLALTAVGSSVFSTSVSKGSPGYAVGSGTSFSAPFVSSLAALLLSENEKLTPADLTAIMEKTATDLGETGWDQYYGYGCINFKAALQYTQSEAKQAEPEIAEVANPKSAE